MEIKSCQKLYDAEKGSAVTFELLELQCGTHQVFLTGYITNDHKHIRIANVYNVPVADLAVIAVDISVSEAWLIEQLLKELEERRPEKQIGPKDILTLTTFATQRGIQVNLNGKLFGYAIFGAGYFIIYDDEDRRLPGHYLSHGGDGRLTPVG
jgi:hypothetical protein